MHLAHLEMEKTSLPLDPNNSLMLTMRNAPKSEICEERKLALLPQTRRRMNVRILLPFLTLHTINLINRERSKFSRWIFIDE